MLTVPGQASPHYPDSFDEWGTARYEYRDECGCAQCRSTRAVRERTAKVNAAPTALYRLFDDDGTLLYVGITSRRPEDRFAEHAATTWWWQYVARQLVEWHPDRIAARAREKAWVQTGLPIVNKTELDMHGKAKQAERERRYRLAKGVA